jgi:hypothetical protein
MSYRNIIGEKTTSNVRATNTIAGDLRGIGAKLLPGAAFLTQSKKPRQHFVTVLNKTLLRRSFGMTRSFTVEQLITLAAMSTDVLDKMPAKINDVTTLLWYVTSIIKVKTFWTYTVSNFQRILSQHGNPVLGLLGSAMSNSMSMQIDPEFGCPLIVKLVMSNRYSEVIHVKRINQATDFSSVIALISQKATAYSILGIEVISGMFPEKVNFEGKDITPSAYFTEILRRLIDCSLTGKTIAQAKRSIFYGLEGHEKVPIDQMIPIHSYSMVGS